MNTTELKALADRCICHPVSRGIEDIEAAGEAIKTLISALESAQQAAKTWENEADRRSERYVKAAAELVDAQDERRALLVNEQNLMERVKALEEGISGLMYWDNGKSEWEAARALLEKTT